MKGTNSKFYSTTEFAEHLGVTDDTVRRRVHDGSLRGVRLGRLILIPKSELDRLVAGVPLGVDIGVFSDRVC